MAEVLNVQLRQTRGKHNARRLRKAGMVPAVLYGHGEGTVALSVPAEALDTAVRRGSRVVKLVGEVQEQVFLRELQWDTWGTHVMHVDFTRVSEHEKVEVEVEVELRGEAPGQKEGGAIDQPLHRILLECEVTAIPEKVRVNINHLNLGDSITAGQLELPDGARLVADAETVVVQCVERAAELEEVEGEGGEVEPEIIGRKKEEEETTE